MNDTYITLQGNLGTDVRFRETAKGAVANFRVCATPRYVDRASGAWVDGKPTWYAVAAWRGLARNCADSLRCGDPVFVHGRLSSREWIGDAGPRTELEVEASVVGHDLNRGRTDYTKTGASTQPAPGEPGEVVPEAAA